MANVSVNQVLVDASVINASTVSMSLGPLDASEFLKGLLSTMKSEIAVVSQLVHSTISRCVTRREEFVHVKPMWREDNVTNANLATLIFRWTTNLVVLPASAMAIHLFVLVVKNTMP